LQHAVLQDRDPIPHRHRLDLVMGNEDERGAKRLVLLLQLDPRLHPQLRIKVGQRLIEKEGLRFANDGTAERDALSLATGKLPRLAFQQMVETENVRCIAHATFDLGTGHAAHLQPEAEIVENAHMRIERI
jgi:hypothetical protein